MWEVKRRRDGFLVIDPQGNQCITANVRVLSPTKFVIRHPVYPDWEVDTEQCHELGAAFIGNLEARIKEFSQSARISPITHAPILHKMMPRPRKETPHG